MRDLRRHMGREGGLVKGGVKGCRMMVRMRKGGLEERGRIVEERDRIVEEAEKKRNGAEMWQSALAREAKEGGHRNRWEDTKKRKDV